MRSVPIASSTSVRKLLVVGLLFTAMIATLLYSAPQADARTHKIRATPGHSAITKTSKSVTEGTARIAFKVPKLSKGGAVFAVEMRSQGSKSTYRSRVLVLADGTRRVGITRVTKGKEVVLSSRTLSGKVKAGQTIWIEGSVSGSRAVSLAVRTWRAGTAKPKWQQAHIDSSSARISRPGKVRGWYYLSNKAPKAVTARYRTLTVVNRAVVPTTRIVSGAAHGSTTTSTRSRFTFTSSTRDATFQCRVDRGSFRACTSGITLSDLSLGKHVFEVRSRSYRGIVDPTPETRYFTVRSATSTPKPPPVIDEARPTASNTGVPAGTKLTVHRGDIVVTKDGTRLDRMDVHGFVVVRADNVKITNSVVRGGVAKGNQGLITNYGWKNLLVENTTLVAAHPSVWLDGLKGWNFTARRIHVVGNVDSIKIHGDNVTVEKSLLEKTTYYSSDPNQKGGPTHNDNIQILNGHNITITGNDISGAQNFAILGAANLGHTSNLTVEGNWLDGGHCTVKLQSMKGWNLDAVVTGNRFGPHRAVSYCAFQAEPQVDVKASDNRMEADGSPVTMLRVK